MNVYLAQLDAVGFRVVGYLLATVWQSTILFAAVAGVSWWLRKRPAWVRHALWLTALLGAPILPLAASVLSSTGAPQAPVSALPAYAPPGLGLPSGAAVALETAATATAAQPDAQPQPVRFRLLDVPWAVALLAYAVGVTAFLAWFLVGHTRVFTWIRAGVPVLDPRVLRAFAAARYALGTTRPVRIVSNPAVSAPITVGAFGSAVLLPEGLLARLTDEELAAVTLHETAHAKRRDALVLTLAALVRALLFFHPLVWLASRQVATLGEHAADDAVLAAAISPLSYAKLLIRIAGDVPRRTASAEFAVGIVLSRKAFIQRIEAILSDRRSQIRKLTRLGVAGTAVAALFSLGVALALPLRDRGDTPSSAIPEASRFGMNREQVEQEDSAARVGGPGIRAGQEIQAVLKPGHLKEHKVLDPRTGRIVARDATEVYLAWTRLAGDASRDTAGLEIQGIQVWTGRLSPIQGLDPKKIYPTTDRPAADLWAAITPDDLPPAPEDPRENKDVVITPLGSATGALEPYPLPYPWAFKTDDGGIGVFEITEVRGQDVHVRYKFLKAPTAEKTAAQDRTLHFPPDHSLGLLKVLAEQERGSRVQWWWGVQSEVDLGKAQGDVYVPAGVRLGLAVSPAGWQDPASLTATLADQPPGVIETLWLDCGTAEEKPGDRLLAAISRLAGLKVLYLNDTGVTGAGLAQLAGLKSLERLAVLDERLDETGIAAVAEIKLLKGLRLHADKPISERTLSRLTTLPLLEELCIAVEKGAYGWLTRMPSLQCLHLSGSGHGADGIAQLAGVPALRWLGIYDLSDEELAALPVIPFLKELEIQGKGYEYTAAGLGNLSRLTGLESLTIRGRYQDEALAALKPLPALKHLSLHGNFQDRDWITDASLAHVSAFESLESLEIYTGRFTDDGLQRLTKLPNLRRLYIPNNSGFTDAGMAYIANALHLEALNLRATQITDAGLTGLGDLPALQELTLFCKTQSDITDEAIARLKERRPGLVVKLD